jgi:hypothetical protein|tara:strand:- start:5530 stop:5736 length:207 start_codon:yes stop_codon:yes gene_type:complete
MVETHKKKLYTDIIIDFIKKELLESDFKETIQIQLLYILIPIILIIAILNFFTTLFAFFIITYINGKN